TRSRSRPAPTRARRRRSTTSASSGCSTREARGSACSWAAGSRPCRVSRATARMKFMIDDIGPEGMRERAEARLGRTLADFTLPQLPAPGVHLGVHDGYVGVPVHLGLISGDQMIALAELGHDVRITRQQNLVVATSDDIAADLARIGLP